MAEVESVLNGFNLTLKWGLLDLKTVKTDSANVCEWIETIIKEEEEAAEIIIKQKLGNL